ncbi:hypothetical protein A3Q56_03089 [Intoshia linei]|uniref:Uncharacterized protein n=1 Tax=Intoshia linei TaxID=1819745 RepID=A0A177B4X8_9BILA|nr:hypothetical protein A3Q56_03089 [Intoshia linei]
MTICSYTLECNYNMGRIINKLSPVPNDVYERTSPPLLCKFPPKYTPTHYEQIGRALAISALDFINDNPLSRLNTSEYFYLNNVRDVIRRNLRKKCEKLKHKQKDEPKIITFSFKNVDNFLKENKIANNFKMCDEFSVNSINSNNVLSKSMNNFIQNKFTPKKDKNIKQKLLNSRNRGKNLKSKIFVKAKHNQHTKFEIKKESNHEDTWKKRKNNMTSLKVKNSVKLDVGFQRNKSCYDFKKTNIDSNVVIKNDEKRKNYIFRIINNKYQDKCKKTGRKRTWKLGKINPKCQIADDIQSISRNFTNLNILTNDNVENI